MVHPDAGIPAESISEVIPIHINRLSQMGLPYGIGPTLRDPLGVCLPCFRKEHRISNPSLGLVRIEGSWHRVENPTENRQGVPILSASARRQSDG